MTNIFTGFNKESELSAYDEGALIAIIHNAGIVNILSFLHEVVWEQYVKDRKWYIKEMYECIIRGKHAYLMQEVPEEFRKLYG